MLSLIELSVLILGGGFLATQILLPLWRGTALFPILRRERKLESDLAQAKQEGVEHEIESEIKKERRNTNGK